MSRTRPPQKQKKKVPKTWDEGALLLGGPCRPARPPCQHVCVACLPGSLLRQQPQLMTASNNCPAVLHATAAAEYWENYTGPRIMENRYVWAAATAAATLAAVYSSAVQRGALR